MVRARAERVVVSDLDVGVARHPSSEQTPAATARRIMLRNGIRPIGEVTVRPFERLDAVIAGSFPDTGTRREVPPSADDVAVVICSRNRSGLLRDCLEAVAGLDPPPGDVLVVDNGSDDESTQRVAESCGVRWVVERRAGLDRARNRGIAETTLPIVAYLDDDTRPASWWAGAVQEAFDDPSIGAASGLVLAGELKSWSQRAFEAHAGMHKGFRVRTFGTTAEPIGFEPQRAGVGANMSFRRTVLESVDGFDVALDLGTPSSGGGDLDMLFRVHRAGFLLRYDPAIFVRHVHRTDRAGLRRQLTNYGVGYTAFLEKHAAANPQDRAAVARHIRRWRLRRLVVGLASGIVRLDRYRVFKAVHEARGSRRGAEAYHRSIWHGHRDVERRAATSLMSVSTDAEE